MCFINCRSLGADDRAFLVAVSSYVHYVESVHCNYVQSGDSQHGQHSNGHYYNRHDNVVAVSIHYLLQRRKMHCRR